MADMALAIPQVISFFNSLITLNILETYMQLFVFTLGLFVYAIFVWYFYRSLSKRDLFSVNLEKYNLPTVKHKTLGKVGSVLAYILKYGFVFPIYIFLWFLLLSLFLLVLSQEILIEQIILTSIIIVSATRVTAYYKEELASDLAKLMPLAILAILLSSPNFFSLEAVISRVYEIPKLWSRIIQFLLFSIFLEWMLRIIHLAKNVGNKKTKPKESQ